MNIMTMVVAIASAIVGVIAAVHLFNIYKVIKIRCMFSRKMKTSVISMFDNMIAYMIHLQHDVYEKALSFNRTDILNQYYISQENVDRCIISAYDAIKRSSDYKRVISKIRRLPLATLNKFVLSRCDIITILNYALSDQHVSFYEYIVEHGMQYRVIYSMLYLESESAIRNVSRFIGQCVDDPAYVNEIKNIFSDDGYAMIKHMYQCMHESLYTPGIKSLDESHEVIYYFDSIELNISELDQFVKDWRH